MTRRTRVGLKSVVWAACLAPLAYLGWCFWTDDLTANPISFITNTLGEWTFRLLLASLALTPIRLITGAGWPITLRRLLGLFAFFYGCLHFAVWIGLDHFFNWTELGTDIAKRPYITVGLAALVLMIPLAATSTTGMIRRLGGRNWNRLHRLVYATAVLAALHFLWLAKVGRREQYLYAALVALLLGIRGVDAARRWLVRRRRSAGTVTARPLS